MLTIHRNNVRKNLRSFFDKEAPTMWKWELVRMPSAITALDGEWVWVRTYVVRQSPGIKPKQLDK